MKFELDHIGVAVRSLQQATGLYKALGWAAIPVESVSSEKVKVAFVEMENQAAVELLEPTSEDSVIAKFLSKRGEGIHHICLRVQDLDAALVRLKAAGVRLIDEKPRPGAKNCRVAFIHPSSCNGVLVELSEPRKEGI